MYYGIEGFSQEKNNTLTYNNQTITLKNIPICLTSIGHQQQTEDYANGNNHFSVCSLQQINRIFVYFYLFVRHSNGT